MVTYYMRVSGAHVLLCNRLRISVSSLCDELNGLPACLSLHIVQSN